MGAADPGPPPLDGPPRARGGRRRRADLQVGEEIIVGRRPDEAVVITVENGTALRQIKTWALPMAEVVEIVAEALRLRVERPGSRR